MGMRRHKNIWNLFYFSLRIFSICAPLQATPAIEGNLQLYIVRPDKSMTIHRSEIQQPWQDGDLRVHKLVHQLDIRELRLSGHTLIFNSGTYLGQADYADYQTPLKKGSVEILGQKIEHPFGGNDGERIWARLPLRNGSLEFKILRPIKISLPVSADLEYSENASNGRITLSDANAVADVIAANVGDYFTETAFKKNFEITRDYQWTDQIPPVLVDVIDENFKAMIEDLINNQFREKLKEIIIREVTKATVALSQEVPRLPIDLTANEKQKLILTREAYGWKIKYLEASESTSDDLENQLTSKIRNKVVIAADQKALNGLLKAYIRRQGKDRYLLPEQDPKVISMFFAGQNISTQKKYEISIDLSKGESPTIEPWLSDEGVKHFDLTVPFTLKASPSDEVLVNKVFKFEIHNSHLELTDVANPGLSSAPSLADKVRRMFVGCLNKNELNEDSYQNFARVFGKAKFLGEQTSDSHKPEIIAFEWDIPSPK
jgi:hypothetical protein